MTSLSAAVADGQPNSAATRNLSSMFGIAAASSLRKVVPRRKKDIEKATSKFDEPGAAQPESSQSNSTEADAPESRNRRGPIARIGGSSQAAPAATRREQRGPSRRFRTVQVRDRRFIHTFLLAAAKTAPTGPMLIDFVKEGSDGVFDLSPGVVYRELHRLEKERLITVRRDSRERRYTLTELGQRILASRRGEWEAFSHGVTRLFEEADVGERS